MQAWTKHAPWLVIAALLWSSWTPSTAAQGLNPTLLDPNAGAQGTASPNPIHVSAQFVVPAAGKPGLLQISATIEEGWHTYSITQPKGGPLATKIALTPSAAFELAGDFTPNPAPEKHVDNEVFKGLTLEEHRKQVTWSAPVKFAAGVNPAEVTIAGKVTAQACSDVDNNCLPPRPYDFAAPFKPTANDGFRENAELSKAILRGRIEPASVAPGGKAKLILSAEPVEDFHIYALEAAPTPAASGYKATLIALTQSAGFTWGKPVAVTSPIEKTSSDMGKSWRVHKEQAEWTLDITVPAATKPGEYTLAGLIGFQTCDAVCCLPARGASFVGTLTVGTGAASDAVPLSFSAAKYGEVALALEQTPVTKSLDFAALPSMIGFSLLGGLILNLMPCVLPVIGLKILSFVEQAGHSRARVFTLNVWYTLGLLSVFAVLATLAVSLNLGWGQQFQSTGFNIVMSGIVFAMALSFLGVWEIPLPGFVGSGAANDLQQKEGAGGAFFKGVLTTVLATPCSGPFLGPVFGFTLKQPPVVTYIVFLCIGLGMASPYLLIGAFPRLIKFLPKPGAWMDTFKQLLAFVLLGTVVFMFTFLKREYVVPTFGMLIAIWAGCWWIGRTPLYEGARKLTFAWGQGLAAAAIAGWVSFALLGPVDRVLPWQPFSPERLTQLTKIGKTVMVDFTAEWCLTCKLNLKNAIDVQDVKQVVEANGVVPLLADWTDESDEIKRALESLGSNSIPVLAIFPAGKPSEPIILRDLISSRAAVIDALQQAGPSQPAAGAPVVSATTAAKSMN